MFLVHCLFVLAIELRSPHFVLAAFSLCNGAPWLILHIYTPKCAPGALGIWSEVICRGGAGYRTDILEPALRPRSNIGLPDICSMSGAQRSSMEAPVGNYLTTQNSQISEPTQGSPERVLTPDLFIVCDNSESESNW